MQTTKCKRQLSDAEVDRAIESVQLSGKEVTGQAVRQELTVKHGLRGGAVRIYRAVAAFKARTRSAEALILRHSLEEKAVSIEALLAQVEDLNQRLAESERREDTYSRRLLLEIDTLRCQVKEFAGLRRSLSQAQESNLKLHREAQGYRNQIQTLQGQVNKLTIELSSLKSERAAAIEDVDRL